MNHEQPQTLDSLTNNHNLNSGSDPDLDTEDVEVNTDLASSAINNEENDPGRVDIDAEYERFLLSGRVDIDSELERYLSGRVDVDAEYERYLLSGRVDVDADYEWYLSGRVDIDPEYGPVNSREVFNIDLAASSAINNEENNDPGRVDVDAEYERYLSGRVDIDADYEWYLMEWESMGNGRLYDDNGSSVLPAAKLVVENLPVVEIGDGGGGVGCAVCTEDIGVGDKASRLHCGHYYHGECIGPWLAIKNTCPLCRYELPTDDPEYEGRRKIRRLGSATVTRE